MEKRWVLKKRADEEQIKHISKELKINEKIANLLCQRGITTFEEAQSFFRPKLTELHDPFLMKDMDKAIARLSKAVEEKERILIYGDYDVDGTTAVALVYSYLSQCYKELDFYIPDRDTEGYGVSFQGIDYAFEQGISLIICLDCGIKATEQIEYAHLKNIDFIVADHHLPGEELPLAYAILDPKRADCHYPYKELSGCGIGFKLIQAYEQSKGKGIEQLIQYLDLVAISIAADIVPIMGENRILAYYGIQLLNTTPRAGIEALLKYSNIVAIKQDQANTKDNDHYFTKELTISDLVFLIGPRINAAGRIESGKNSVRLLLAKDSTEAENIASQINEYNDERKHLDTTATQEAKILITSNDAFSSKKTIVVYQADWHKGIIGIVASRIVEEFYKPAIVFTRSNDHIVGSARSIKDFDIHTAIESCSSYLEHFGGHKFAAGLSLKPENLDSFIQAFEKKVEESLSNEDMIPEIEIDEEISLADITPKFFRILKQFAPFGPGNMPPIFKTDNLMDTGFSRTVGTNHLKMSIIHWNQRSDPFPGIGFQLGAFYEDLKAGKKFSICYQIEENFWNGKCEKQLNVKDILFNS